MNTDNTIINMSNIENPNYGDDVKINIYQRKSECLQQVESEKMEDESDVCCICLDNMAGDIHLYIRCGHRIHEECYKELSISNKLNFCPLCRVREPHQTETIVETLGDGNVQIINIINLRVSRVHPEGIHELHNTIIRHKLALILSVIWLLILIGIIIFALTPVFK
jgi:hypothetical protein